MDFNTRYQKLNPAQKQAVDSIEGPVMVIAGPGTGKTELLSMRAANILTQTDTLPGSILCLTFTESGAVAMRRRLREIIGPDAYKIAIHTFHSFGTEVINQNREFFYRGADFHAADELSSYELLRGIFDELEYDNPLASKINGEYTYLRDTLGTISELKRSGLTSDELLAVLDANDAVLDKVEPLVAKVFATRIDKHAAEKLAPLVPRVQESDGAVKLPGITPLSRIIADSLATAIDEFSATNSTKPITSWKNTWLKKDETGTFVFKSRDRQAKLRAVSYIYYQYLARMEQAQLFDFDDMILNVVHTMEVRPELLFNLQERYQYIMVDEFQDTNLAQMRILYNLTNNPVNEGRPNILVVGDDDQAIYSFQGADVGNIHAFRELYPQTKLIVLTDNYRSTETVLRHARSVITLGVDRLENKLPVLDKTLTAHQRTPDTTVSLIELPSASDERSWIARDVATKIKSGVNPSSIAVLARRHHEILDLLPYLSKQHIQVNYERRDNVLDLEIIRLLEHLAHILVALARQQHDITNSLLPELLAHPAFAIDPIEIWRLSLRATQNRQSWMEIMATTPAFIPLHTWLITLSQALTYTPLELLLDKMIGASSQALDSTEMSRQPLVAQAKYLQPERKIASEPDFTPGAKPFGLSNEGEGDQKKGDASSSAYISPIYTHYFSPNKLRETPDAYLTYLEALRTIRVKLREYHPNDTPTLETLLEFMRLHRELGSSITLVRSRADHLDKAINLMTAHKSKGLEFEHVYILGAVDNTWGERARARGRLIGYPENLPLAVSGDTFDERLRLFFVAMTRAKSQLSISYHTRDDNGKETLQASFLAGEPWQNQIPEISPTMENLTEITETVWYQPVIAPMVRPMRDLLAPVLDAYKLSSTHLTSFLDVSRGGPQAFLINYLLRFPQAPAPSASFGTAIHAALARAHSHLSATGNQRPVEDVLHDFEASLKDQRLSDEDFRIYLQRGTDVLTDFLSAKYDDFAPTQKTELDFANQSVFLGEAHLTGKLDLVDIDEGMITVTDYKTGKASRNWQGRTDYEKIKLHKYKQQLMFYNLLINHSRDFARYTFSRGVLQFVEPTPKGEIIALEATFSHDDLKTFSRLVQKVWQRIRSLDLPDTSRYDPSYKGMIAFEADLMDDNV